MARLIQTLPDGPLDIVGDVHGELEALHALLDRLGCDAQKCTATRPVVFVGDLIDRGPDSPGVVELVMRLVEAGVAHCIVGNHELNLLFGSKKEGNGWAREDPEDGFQIQVDGTPTHVPFDSAMATASQVDRFLDFFATLPLALVREDLRVVHACWQPDGLSKLPDEADIAVLGKELSAALYAEMKASGLAAKERAELEEFRWLTRLDTPPTRDLPGHAQAAQIRQTEHPIKVLTSGMEQRIPFEDAFFVGGKWRFVRRYDWWNHYRDEAAVVVGHYWRRRADAVVANKPDNWLTPRHTDWTGPRGNVFCVDYSVGRRFEERFRGKTADFAGGLAALRWPERTLVFDDTSPVKPTTNWGG